MEAEVDKDMKEVTHEEEPPTGPSESPTGPGANLEAVVPTMEAYGGYDKHHTSPPPTFLITLITRINRII